MLFGSPEHQHKHKHQHQQHHIPKKQYQSWDTPNSYPVYAVVLEPMPEKLSEAQEYPYGNMNFNNKYGGYSHEDPRRIRQVEYVPAYVRVKANDPQVEENVDAEADEFIKLGHKKFQLCKTIASLN